MRARRILIDSSPTKSVMILIIIALGFLRPAAADPLPASLGLYADHAGTVDRMAVEPGQPFTLNLLLNRGDNCQISHPFAWSWGCRIAISDNVTLLDWGEACGVNNLVPPDFLVTCQGSPPGDGMTIHLLSLSAILADNAPGHFYIHGFSYDGVEFPPAMTVWDGLNSPCVTWLQPASGDSQLPVFLVTVDNASPVDFTTWGKVKALYDSRGD